VPGEREQNAAHALQERGLAAYGPGPGAPVGRGIHTYRLTAQGARMQSQMEAAHG